MALVRALLTPADILVLDEPTNHLDNEMSEWLEEYLIQFRGAILMVTHDRYFLDRVVNRIVEVDHGKLYNYPGNYSEFVRLKAERQNMELATERKRKKPFADRTGNGCTAAQGRGVPNRKRILTGFMLCRK